MKPEARPRARSSGVLSLAEVVAATGGLSIHLASERAISSVAVDSRRAGPGSLFVALPGARTDGHEFLGQAVSAGAVCLIVSKGQAARRAGELQHLAGESGVAVVAVPDTLAALQDLARCHMRKLSEVRRIGVTGSNGKTTTKEILGSILSRTARTAVNAGNYNSEIGLPIACFSVDAGHTYAVFEMGVNRIGEMDILADIVLPDLALITNVGTAHIGLLGSQEGIAREKRKIFSHFDGRQVGFVGEDEKYFPILAEGVRGRIVRYGARSTAGFGGSESLGLGGTLIHWEESRIRFPLFGQHNLANALGAIALARELGAPSSAIKEGLEAVSPPFGRSQIFTGEAGGGARGTFTVVFDGYNANPDSMEKAIAFVEQVAWNGRKIAVLGAMRELGDQAERLHRELGERLGRSSFDSVLLIGEEMEHAWRALVESGRAGSVHWYTGPSALATDLAAHARPGDLILVKGSRGLELERLLPAMGVAEPMEAPCS